MLWTLHQAGRHNMESLFTTHIIASLRHSPDSMTIRIFIYATILLGLTVAGIHAEDIRFDRDIRPLLSNSCFHCHGPDEQNREADLRLDLEEEAKAYAIVPGDLDASELISRILTEDPELRMPPAEANKDLKPEEVELIKKWVKQGAAWSKHWSFEAPVKAKLPDVKDNSWPRNEIDHFVLARLDQEGLSPNSAADRRTLIRRLSFDLTGLPPTPEQVAAYLNDTSENAYEKLVDRLLASKHYGERMGVMWLDAARYGDTSVYHADGYRDMWAWRDRVVDSYNENQPFDQFSIEQLAGDLIPNGTINQKIAAGFNRNNGTTDEGGLIPEEYRVEYAVDRVKTTSTVWMGLTMECSQCHEHKYDPISQTEYYQFFAFFNRSADEGSQTRRRNSSPLVNILDPEKKRQLPALREKLSSYQNSLEGYKADLGQSFQEWIQTTTARLKEKKPLPQGAELYFPFEKGEGEVVQDRIDTNRKGKINGNIQWTKGRFGNAVKLDGETMIRLERRAEYERTNSFSYGGWVWKSAATTGAFIAKMVEAQKHRGYDLLLAEDGSVQVHLIHSWPENALKVTTKNKIDLHQWNHIFVTYDGSSKAEGIRVYVNGESWPVVIEQDSLTGTIKNDTSLRTGSRDPGNLLTGIVDEIRAYPRRLNQEEITALYQEHPLEKILTLEPNQRTKEQQEEIKSYYLNNVDPTYMKLARAVHAAKAEEEELLKPMTSVMVMGDQEMPRETFVLNRGAYDSPTEEKVQPGTPEALPAMAEGLPANRLGMAKWLFQADHPLTARVAVNRYWQMLFGYGFVTTPEDFGAQGEFPSHPELLDWLAVDFRESGWDVKRMLKKIVMSATYRQSSHSTAALSAQDPLNRMLSRGARFRLQSEFIRDNALMLSGLLVDKQGGPGVKPYQPPGLWKEVGLGGKPSFEQDHGDKLYRRSIYTYWKRSAPPPSMQIFDAPTREKCTVRRPRTNTPLQALVMLNDIQFVEAAVHYAQVVLEASYENDSDRARYAFEMATSRIPTDTELNVMLEVLEKARQEYQVDQTATESLLNTGESKPNQQLDQVDHAAWTVVTSMILNLDEVLTRE